MPNKDLYLAHVVEEHFHSRERWFGAIGGPDPGGPYAEDSLAPFQVVGGNAVYGTALEIFGTGDTPVITNQIFFDFHRLLVVGVTNDNPFKLRFIYGKSLVEYAIAAGQYTEVMVKFDSTNPQLSAGIPVEIQMPRLLCGEDQIWAQCKNEVNEAQIDLFAAAHGYDE